MAPLREDPRAPLSPGERERFVREHTRFAPAPLVPEIRALTADAVGTVWFELARFLDDDQADVPFWCVPWAGGQALARWVLDHPQAVRGKRVLDFACGGGIVGIAAARAGAAEVSAVDVDPFARIATTLAAAENGVAIDVSIANRVGQLLAGIDVVLAGDVWYEPGPSAAFRRWFRSLTGCRVLTGDSGRPHAPRRARELARYEVPTPFELEARAVRMGRVLELDARVRSGG